MSTIDRTTATDTHAPPGCTMPLLLVLRVVTALALVVDAVVHLRLASGYQLSAPGGIGAGNLFRLQAALAVAVAVFVLVRGARIAYAAAFLVALSALGAVLLYRYVDVPGFGPLPPMYEPVWFAEKSLSAIAEAIGVLTAAIGIALTRSPVSPPSHRGD